MSKERELLESCLDEMQYHSLICPELVLEIQELLAQPEQEPVRYEYQDENGEWKQFEDKKHFIDNQKWGEPTRALYTSPQKRDHVLHENTQYLLDQVSRLTADISALEGVIKLLSKELYKIEGVE